MTPYEIGYKDAMEKIALTVPKNIGWWGRRISPELKNFRQSAKTMAIGKPREAYRQLRDGTFFERGVYDAAGNELKPAGLGRTGLEARTPLDKVLMYGFPAMSVAQTVASDTPDKAEELGSLGAGILAGGLAYGPVGMLGSIPVAALAEYGTRKFIGKGKNLLGIGSGAAPAYNSNVPSGVLNESRGTINPA
jgi:hypothetical protein